MFQFFRYSLFLAACVLLILPVVYSSGLLLSGSCLVSSDYFLFDRLSFYLIVLVVFLGIYTVIMLKVRLKVGTVSFLLLSLVFSGLCFCVNHSVLFWCFYELSMLPLLFLIFRDSPYSERFIAGWYFSVYLLVTSLPLILLMIYLSYVKGSCFISSWVFRNAPIYTYVLLSFIFFTKVPLRPFHTWLPIVHAEATRIVSIFLSGYIMKLGLLGVYRCAPFLFRGELLVYFFICCVFSICFILTAAGELDGKRWLAFLSLSHILVPFLGFFCCGFDRMSLTFLFCLGHGLSAGLVFGLLWLFYDVTNSRNWLILKGGISGKSLMFGVIFGLLSLCSFPPTLQFFCEVYLVSQSVFSILFLFFWCLYLFFGGLVPLVLCGHLLIRVEGTETSGYRIHAYILYFFFLSAWCYAGFMIL